jgi:endonuclease/exonuclease/phosphatase (EEP) superfamily protein YafD
MDDAPSQAPPSMPATGASLPSHMFQPEGDATVVGSPSRRRRLGRWFVLGVIGIALVHPVGSLLGRRFWIADLISHFQEPALVATCVASVVAIAAKRRRIAVGLVALAVFQTFPLLRYSGANPVPPDPSSKARLRVLLSNVLYENFKYDDLEELIRAEKPDIVALVEYAPGWSEAIAAIRAEYPYRVEHPARASGLALWFKERPMTIGQPELLVQDGHPVIHARFIFAGKERDLWLVHPRSPLSRRRFLTPGNAEMDAIAARVKGMGGSTIVVGDMNSTDGSAHFRDLLKTTGLRDSRLGFGRQGSWPTDQPYRIAIDHVFVSRDLAVSDRRIGPTVGSDHFPVIVDLAPAASATK